MNFEFFQSDDKKSLIKRVWLNSGKAKCIFYKSYGEKYEMIERRVFRYDPKLADTYYKQGFFDGWNKIYGKK